MNTAIKRLFTHFLFIVLVTMNLNAQPKCKVEYFSTEQGLSHGTISEILKDKEGFMWFGTWDGINRFDGRNFASFKSSQGEMAQTGDYRIAQVVEDQSGYLWIRTRNAQVYRFDKKTNYFLSISPIIEPGAKEKIYIDSIVSVKNGLVWLQSREHGIYCLQQSNVTKGNVMKFGSDHADRSYQSSNFIYVFHEDQQQRIWMATSKGMTCLAPSFLGVYKAINIIPNNIINKRFTDVAEDESALYFSSDDGNIITYNKRSLAFSMQKITDTRINAVLRSHRDSKVYAVTGNGKVISLDLSNRKVTVAQYRKENLYSIFEDRSGALWMEQSVAEKRPWKHGLFHF